MDPKLYEAAVSGDVQLLSEVAHANVQSLLSKAPHENTALHISVMHGHAEFIKDMLVRCPQLLGMKNSQGDTALHQALRNVQVDVAIELFRRDPELAFITNNAQESPLHLAVKEQLQQVVQAMLGAASPDSSGATASNYSAILEDRKRDLVAIKDSTGRTALHYAAWRNDADTVDMILRIDCHMVPYATDEEGFSPLHVAAAFGSIESISKLFKRCPDAIEQLDQKGRNALHIAVLNGQMKTMKALQATPNARQKLYQQDQDGNTPLPVASTNRQPRIMRAVIPEKRNVEDHKFEWDSSANTNVLVATLIATVSFAAGITVPGGFRSDEPNPGTAILTRKAAFQAFILFDSIALFLSISSIITTGWTRRIGSPISRDETLSDNFTFWAFSFMMFAFGMGVYVVVLPRCKWLAILVCSLSFTIPFVTPCAAAYDAVRQVRAMEAEVEDPENPI